MKSPFTCFRSLTGRTKMYILLGFCTVFMAAGWIAWERSGNYMPRSWFEKLGAKDTGIWGDAGPLQWIEDWRFGRVTGRWARHTENLELNGTVWTNDEPTPIYYIFGADGIFHSVSKGAQPDADSFRSKLENSRFDFDGTRGFSAIDHYSTVTRGLNIYFRKDDSDVGKGTIGYNGSRMFLNLREPQVQWESRLRQIAPDSPEIPCPDGLHPRGKVNTESRSK